MSELKKKVLQSLIKQMHALQAAGEAEEPMEKSSLSDALEEAKEDAKEPEAEDVEDCEVSDRPVPKEPEEEVMPARKKKPAVSVSLAAIKASRPVLQVSVSKLPQALPKKK